MLLLLLSEKGHRRRREKKEGNWRLCVIIHRLTFVRRGEMLRVNPEFHPRPHSPTQVSPGTRVNRRAQKGEGEGKKLNGENHESSKGAKEFLLVSPPSRRQRSGETPYVFSSSDFPRQKEECQCKPFFFFFLVFLLPIFGQLFRPSTCSVGDPLSLPFFGEEELEVTQRRHCAIFLPRRLRLSRWT